MFEQNKSTSNDSKPSSSSFYVEKNYQLSFIWFFEKQTQHGYSSSGRENNNKLLGIRLNFFLSDFCGLKVKAQINIFNEYSATMKFPFIYWYRIFLVSVCSYPEHLQEKVISVFETFFQLSSVSFEFMECSIRPYLNCDLMLELLKIMR